MKWRVEIYYRSESGEPLDVWYDLEDLADLPLIVSRGPDDNVIEKIDLRRVNSSGLPVEKFVSGIG